MMLRILHVDDNPQDRDLIEKHLFRLASDLEIIGVDSAEAALRALAGDEFDCIVSDYKMPGMDGLEFLKEVRSRGIKIPFFLLTGKGNESIAAEALRAGADVYWTKEEGVKHHKKLLNDMRDLSESTSLKRKLRQAESALKTTSESLLRMVEMLPLPAAIQSSGVLRYFNSIFLQLLEAESPEDLMGADIINLIAPEGRDSFRAVLRETESASSRFRHTRERFVTFNGGIVDAEVTTTGMVFLGKPSAFLLIKDMGRRVRAEERLRLISEHIHPWEFLISSNGRFIWVSPSCKRVTGYDAQAFITDAAVFERIVHPEDKGRVIRHLKSISTPAGESHLEFRIVGADGAKRWISHHCAPVYDSDGKYAGCRASNTDITDFAAAREVLESVRSQLGSIEKAAAMGCWELDLRSRKLDWSEGVHSLFGLAPRAHKPSQESVLSLILTEDRAGVLSAIEESLSTGRPLDVEFRIKLQDGELRVIREQAEIVTDESGKPARMLGTVRDVTELTTAKSRLAAAAEAARKQKKLINQLNREIESLVYSVTRNLQTPLRRAISSLESAHSAGSREPGSDMDARINSAMENCAALAAGVEKLSNFAWLARSAVTREEVDLSSLVSEILNELKSDSTKRTVDVVIEGGILASADSALIRAALERLLASSWRHTRDVRAARIEFGRLERNGRVNLFIRDNGPRVSLGAAEKLSLGFHRGDSAPESMGIDIDQAIVERIINRHGGSVWAESPEDRGNLVIFTLD